MTIIGSNFSLGLLLSREANSSGFRNPREATKCFTESGRGRSRKSSPCWLCGCQTCCGCCGFSAPFFSSRLLEGSKMVRCKVGITVDLWRMS